MDNEKQKSHEQFVFTVFLEYVIHLREGKQDDRSTMPSKVMLQPFSQAGIQ